MSRWGLITFVAAGLLVTLAGLGPGCGAMVDLEPLGISASDTSDQISEDSGQSDGDSMVAGWRPLTGSMESGIAEQIFEVVNENRARSGLSALAFDDGLDQAAQIQASHMAALGQMGHDLPGVALSTLLDRIRYVGYDYLYLGENLAFGYPTAASVVDGWMNSPGHRQNMLNSDYTQIGIGVAFSTGRPYYCVVFGKPL